MYKKRKNSKYRIFAMLYMFLHLLILCRLYPSLIDLYRYRWSGGRLQKLGDLGLSSPRSRKEV